MRICVDIQPAVSQRAGVGRFTQVLAENLVTQASAEDELELFYFDFRRKGAPVITEGAAVRACRWMPGAVVQQSWKRLDFPPYNWFAGRADLYHFNNFVVPPLTCGKSIVTIYDMSFLRHPECAEERNRIYLAARIKQSVERADAVLTISQFSADEIVSFFPEAAGRVHVAYPGIAANFGPASDAVVGTTRKQQGIERPYLLTVGTVEPRKNLSFLVDAFEALDDDGIDLVVAGADGWKTDAIHARIKASPRSRQIRVLGRVDDDKLAALYTGATVYVMPSLYEGFGFPPLEAMACGTPVVSSAGGSLPEVLGEAAMIVPVDDAERWGEALRSALYDTEWRATSIAAGRVQSAAYRWRTTAEKTWDVYRRVIAGDTR